MATLLRHRAILLAYLGMVVLLLLTSVFSPGFLSPGHLRSIAVLAAFVGIVAIGQTFVIIGGGIDLSLPWVLNCAAVLVTLLSGGQDAPLVWVIPLLLAAGALIGMVNGLGIGLFGIPPIIMTLAVNVILQGSILVYTGGAPPGMAPASSSISRSVASPRCRWCCSSGRRLRLSRRCCSPRQRSDGISTALGTSASVAEFSGVPTLRTSVATYTISGFTAALAGILITGYSGQAYLGMGDPFLFTSIAAVAIGGASILGGSGHYVGTIAGAFVLTILTGLLPALNLSNGALLIVYGLVILVTVSLASEAFSDIAAAIRGGLRRETPPAEPLGGNTP